MTLLLLAVAGLAAWQFRPPRSTSPASRIYDQAGVVPPGDHARFDEYLGWIFQESDVDIRLVFLRDLGDLSIEEAAIKWMQELKIGRDAHQERGVLVLFDQAGQRLRIEVGYALEAYFPDAFVGYLIHDHARDYFRSGNVSVGVRLMLRILQDRIRAATLGDAFDPTVLALVRKTDLLSGGAGATATVGTASTEETALRRPLGEDVRKRLVPQDTPEGTYVRYLEWLSLGQFDPQVPLFTAESQRHLASFPISKAYLDAILLKEYGKAFKAEVRGDLALLYFTDDPLIAAYFFRKAGDGWCMDIAAQVRNTVNRVGGIYAWDYRGKDDDFTRAFRDKLISIAGYVRIDGGDNRPLPTRNSR